MAPNSPRVSRDVCRILTPSLKPVGYNSFQNIRDLSQNFCFSAKSSLFSDPVDTNITLTTIFNYNIYVMVISRCICVKMKYKRVRQRVEHSPDKLSLTTNA